jgi:hypothetical protein
VGRNLRGRLGIISVVVLLAAGCGKGEPKVAAVQGKVYHRGAVVAGGTIVFTPDPEMGGQGEVVAAEIGKDGAYTLEAAVGWHRVTVKGPPSTSLPPHYAVFELSGLQREVKADGNNVLDIRLD